MDEAAVKFFGVLGVAFGAGLYIGVMLGLNHAVRKLRRLERTPTIKKFGKRWYREGG